MPTALIIVDDQEDFANKKGALYVSGGEEVATVINKLRNALNADLVVLTQDYHTKDSVSFASNHPGAAVHDTVTLEDGTQQHLWPNHCVQGTEGAAFVKDLVILQTDIIIPKGQNKNVDSYSGFGSADGKQEVTLLLSLLKERGITHVIVTGLAYDYCVAYTVKDACKHGFATCVVKNACRSVSAESAAKEEELMIAAGAKIVEDMSGALAFAKSDCL
jgi:nicotinamidase/pyrazinamidase